MTTTSIPSAFASAISATAVMPQSTVSDEADALLREARDRLARDAVALLEPARQVPDDVGTRLAQGQDCERGRADPVDVVVAVDADPGASRDGAADGVDRLLHVAEEKRVVRRLLTGEKGSRSCGVCVASSNEDAGGDLAHPERLGQRADLVDRARAKVPSSVGHRQLRLRAPPDSAAPVARARYGSRPVRRPRNDSTATLTQSSTSPMVAPTTTTASGA